MKVSREISELVPYVPGKAIAEAKREFGLDSVIKLASNENALGPSPKAVLALQGALSEIHRYPDPGAYAVVWRLAQIYGIEPAWILLGNGSNELIDLLIRVYCEPGDTVLTSQTAFIAFKICAQAARVRVVEVAPRADRGFAIPQLLAAAQTHRPKIIYLPNPNNPTGCYINRAEMDQLLQAWGGRDDVLVLIDEAYLDFVRASDYPKAMEMLKAFSNVVVIHTMSKVYGLAGLRLGALYARPEITDFLQRVRNPFNVNALAQVAVLAALEDQDYLRASRELVWSGLDYFYAQLTRLHLSFTPSQGNFVLFDTERDGNVVNHELMKKGVVLRPLKPYGLPQHLRITAGLRTENEAAMAALGEVLPKIAKLQR